MYVMLENNFKESPPLQLKSYCQLKPMRLHASQNIYSSTPRKKIKIHKIKTNDENYPHNHHLRDFLFHRNKTEDGQLLLLAAEKQ